MNIVKVLTFSNFDIAIKNLCDLWETYVQIRKYDLFQENIKIVKTYFKDIKTNKIRVFFWQKLNTLAYC